MRTLLSGAAGALLLASTAPAAGDDDVTVKGSSRPPPRGVGEITLSRELLQATPHATPLEMLGGAPGVFVDHEEGDGLANDVHLRGFDVEHGGGIEFRLGPIPVNVPSHVQGPGYADMSFVIPEVVSAIRVQQGIYDPHQGDAAIAGTVSYELGVADRGLHLGASYGSFAQRRLVGIIAPRGEADETFGAVALRGTDGFGPRNRASSSASAMGQYGVDLGLRTHLKLLASAYGSDATLPGVVRRDDVDQGAIGLFDSYPTAIGQSAQASRLQGGLELLHVTRERATVAASAWVAVTDLRLRQNFTGATLAAIDPGDLIQTTNAETAAGGSVALRTARVSLGDVADFVFEPGVSLRQGATDQTRTLLRPADGSVWGRELDGSVRTTDLGGYADAELRLQRALRIAGGLRADALLVAFDDHLANPGTFAPAGALGLPHRTAEGVPVSPRVSASLEAAPGFEPGISYGEGFRSAAPSELPEGSTRPYSKVRSWEVGIRARTGDGRFTGNMALFEARLDNELVFDAESAGFEVEGASIRRGVVSGLVAKPADWLVLSTSFTLNHAEYVTPTPDGNHLVPSVPGLLVHGEVGLHHDLAAWEGYPITGRLGVGYTLLDGRHVTDAVLAQRVSVLTGTVSARYRLLELRVDGYNLTDARYPDDETVFVSNWSATSSPRAPSEAAHLSAAPPLTVVGTVMLHL